MNSQSAPGSSGSALYRAFIPAGAALAVFLGACSMDFPSSAPQWDMRWVVPADSTSLSVESLLPASVEVSPDGSAFLLSLDPVNVSRTLAQLCAECALVDGVPNVPKPAFLDSVTTTIALPADLSSAALAGGTVNIQMSHNFNFDPIRPSAAAGSPRGSVTIRIMHGSTQLGQAVIDGTAESFPGGTQKTRALVLAPATITGPLTARVIINSPAGDPVTMNSQSSFTATATPTDFRISQATVRVDNKTVEGTSIDMDVEGIDSSVSDRVKSGGFRFAISNPFTVQGTLSATITAPGISPIVKTMNVTPGQSTANLQFTGDELRSFLGKPDVVLTIGGTVSSTAGGFVTIAPGQEMTIVSKLDMILTTQKQGGTN